MDTQELVVLMSAEIALMSNGRMFFDNSMCLALQQQVPLWRVSYILKVLYLLTQDDCNKATCVRVTDTYTVTELVCTVSVPQV